jgi:tetratricopeptide (TPR) repeat protein
MNGPAAGIADLERALEVAGEDSEMVDVQARIAIALSFAHTEAGQPDEGLRWATWGLKLSRDAKISELEVSFLINMSMAQFNLGRPDLTLRWATEAMDVSESKGLRRYHILALGNAGDAMRALGQFTEAEQTLRAALRETYKVGGGDLLVARMLELAHLLMDQGRGSDAKPYLQEAWRLRPRLTNNRYLLALGMAECRFRLGVLNADPDGACEMNMDDLLANVAAWAATGTDVLPEIELLVYAGLHQMKRKRKYGVAAADRAYALSSDVSPSRLISKPELAAGLLALLQRAGRRKAHKELGARIARAVDARAASIDDPNLRNGYTALPLVQILRD